MHCTAANEQLTTPLFKRPPPVACTLHLAARCVMMGQWWCADADTNYHWCSPLCCGRNAHTHPIMLVHTLPLLPSCRDAHSLMDCCWWTVDNTRKSPLCCSNAPPPLIVHWTLLWGAWWWDNDDVPMLIQIITFVPPFVAVEMLTHTQLCLRTLSLCCPHVATPTVWWELCNNYCEPMGKTIPTEGPHREWINRMVIGMMPQNWWWY